MSERESESSMAWVRRQSLYFWVFSLVQVLAAVHVGEAVSAIIAPGDLLLELSMTFVVWAATVPAVSAHASL